MQEFEANTRAYSKSNAYWLGKMAHISYLEEANIRQQLAQLGYGWERDFVFLSSGARKVDTQAFFAGNDQMLILAFRGTEPDEVRDWVTDFDAAFTAGPGGMVHEGFLTALQPVWREIWQFLQDRRQGRPLWITGHSLGGALAVLATAKLRLEKDEPVHGLYTFGQPRVGDREFARHFDNDFCAQTFRYVNNNDIVPRVPFRAMNYSHVGEFRYFDKDCVQRDDMDWGDIIKDRMHGALDDLLKPGVDGLKDHAMANYLTGLEKA